MLDRTRVSWSLYVCESTYRVLDFRTLSDHDELSYCIFTDCSYPRVQKDVQSVGLHGSSFLEKAHTALRTFYTCVLAGLLGVCACACL